MKMTSPLRIKNARLVLADKEQLGSLTVEDGVIAGIDPGAGAAGGEDFEGDFLIPGLVELHTDHLEQHYHPRPKVYWNAGAALQAHDAQIACSGITTVFDAVRIGSDADSDLNLGEHVSVLMEAISAGRREDRLRAEHFVHLRCEVASSDAEEHFEAYHDYEPVRLASLMDHTPGQRQFVSLDLYYAYYQGKSGRSDEEMLRFISARKSDQEKYSKHNRERIVAMAHAAGLILASHDDALSAHVEEAIEAGVSIAEFPTTPEAAAAARKAGLHVLMGAPNLVRGKSHSGNVSALELARDGHLDILSSDYIPFSMIQGAFLLPQLVEGIDLSQSIAMVSRNPAQAAGLSDRGEIAAGLRADLVRVGMSNGVPVVKSVWRAGRRVA